MTGCISSTPEQLAASRAAVEVWRELAAVPDGLVQLLPPISDETMDSSWPGELDYEDEDEEEREEALSSEFISQLYSWRRERKQNSARLLTPAEATATGDPLLAQIAAVLSEDSTIADMRGLPFPATTGFETACFEGLLRYRNGSILVATDEWLSTVPIISPSDH